MELRLIGGPCVGGIFGLVIFIFGGFISEDDIVVESLILGLGGPFAGGITSKFLILGLGGPMAGGTTDKSLMFGSGGPISGGRTELFL